MKEKGQGTLWIKAPAALPIRHVGLSLLARGPDLHLPPQQEKGSANHERGDHHPATLLPDLSERQCGSPGVESSPHGVGLVGSPGPGIATGFRNVERNSQPLDAPHYTGQAAGAWSQVSGLCRLPASTPEGARTRKSLGRGARADAEVPLLELGEGGPHPYPAGPPGQPPN